MRPDQFSATVLAGLALLLALLLVGWGLVRLLMNGWRRHKPLPPAEWWTSLLEQQTRSLQAISKERLHSERQYNELSQLYPALFQHVPCGFLLFDQSGRVALGTPQLWQHILRCDPVENLNRVDSPFAGVLLELAGRPPGEHAKTLNLAGSTYEVRVHGLPGGGWVGMILDRSVETRLERERQAEREILVLGELAAGIAHEVKNSLAVIQGHVQMLAGTAGDEAITPIRAELDRLVQLVNSFLRSSRPQEREATLFDACDWWQDQQTLWTKRFPAGELLFEPLLLARSTLLRGDAQALSMALGNLILNGYQAAVLCPSPKVIVRMAFAGDQWRLEVEDGGAGFSPEAAARRFVPLVTSKAGGSGLGLYQARNIVRAHGGTMEFLGNPTRVVCRFPVFFSLPGEPDGHPAPR
jgi:signal transduction histidine kinase